MTFLFSVNLFVRNYEARLASEAFTGSGTLVGLVALKCNLYLFSVQILGGFARTWHLFSSSTVSLQVLMV